MSSETAAQPEAAPLVGTNSVTRPKLLYSKKEAAELLSVSPRTIDNIINNRELVARRIGARVLIPYSSLLHFTRRDHRTAQDHVQ